MIHVDHAQFGKHLLFIATDAYSKWPEVFVISSTSAQQALDKLRIMFATHGLPNTLVSDNGPPFTSTEFNNFMKANGIVHRRVPPYHPSLNGLAENMVKTVKHALSKCKVSTNLTIETHIACFVSQHTPYNHVKNSSWATPVSNTSNPIITCSSLCITVHWRNCWKTSREPSTTTLYCQLNCACPRFTAYCYW